MAEDVTTTRVAGDHHVWDRLDGEPNGSWEAFLTYREQPLSDRTVGAVAKLLGKNESGLRRWSKKWQWESRALALDEHLNTVGIDIITMERVEASKRRIRLADSLLSVAEYQLQSWLDDLKANVKLDLTPYEVARIIEIGYKIDRLERGESTDNMAVAIKGERLTDMTEAQLMERAQCILEEMLKKRQISPPQT